jgi:hypothetical protein
LRVLERFAQLAFVAAADELLEGDIEMRAVARLGDRREGLAAVQRRQQVGA